MIFEVLFRCVVSDSSVVDFSMSTFGANGAASGSNGFFSFFFSFPCDNNLSVHACIDNQLVCTMCDLSQCTSHNDSATVRSPPFDQARIQQIRTSLHNINKT